MSTIGDLLAATREELLGVHRAEYDFLGAAVATVNETTITVSDDAHGIVPGAILSIDDELLLCRSRPDATHAVTVVRGWLGSTAATHANGTPVEVQPRFPVRTLRRMLVDEIRSWEPRLYAVATTNVTLADDVRGYDLAAGAFGVLAARLSPDTAWPTNPKSWAKVGARVDGDADTDIFPSGTAVVLDDFVGDATGRTLRVTYAKPFTLTAVDDSVDLQATVGLQPSMEDLARLGVMWRAMAAREVLRTDIHAQGTSRDAAEVQAGAATATAGALKRLRDLRLAEEANNLRLRRGGW